METSLSQVLLQKNGDHYSDKEYLPWVSLISRSEHRWAITHVSHLDWEHAQRIIKSAIAQDRPTVDGEISGSPHSAIDIPALIGALYLCSSACNAGGLQPKNVSDIYNFNIEYKYVYYSWSRFGIELSKVTPTPPMVKICSALQAAHPICYQRLGSEIINLYSASIALLGIFDSMDYSTWKCKCCTSCRVTTGFRALLKTRKRPPGTTQQHILNVAVRELVSTFHCHLNISILTVYQAEIAAKEGLSFKIPVVIMNGQASLSHVSYHLSKYMQRCTGLILTLQVSESTNNDDADDTGIVGRDINVEGERCVSLCRCACNILITT
jgi:hypothetical protein